MGHARKFIGLSVILGATAAIFAASPAMASTLNERLQAEKREQAALLDKLRLVENDQKIGEKERKRRTAEYRSELAEVNAEIQRIEARQKRFTDRVSKKIVNNDNAVENLQKEIALQQEALKSGKLTKRGKARAERIIEENQEEIARIGANTKRKQQRFVNRTGAQCTATFANPVCDPSTTDPRNPKERNPRERKPGSGVTTETETVTPPVKEEPSQEHTVTETEKPKPDATADQSLLVGRPECWKESEKSIEMLAPPFPVGSDKLETDEQAAGFQKNVTEALNKFRADPANNQAGVAPRISRLEAESSCSSIPIRRMTQEELAQARAQRGLEYFNAALSSIPDSRAPGSAFSTQVKATHVDHGPAYTAADRSLKGQRATSADIAAAVEELKNDPNSAIRSVEDWNVCCSNRDKLELKYTAYQWVKVKAYASIFDPSLPDCQKQPFVNTDGKTKPPAPSDGVSTPAGGSTGSGSVSSGAIDAEDRDE